MKMPWTKRAEEAERRAEDAKNDLTKVEQQWKKVRAATAPVHRHHDLNGWTDAVKTIFGGTQ